MINRQRLDVANHLNIRYFLYQFITFLLKYYYSRWPCSWAKTKELLLFTAKESKKNGAEDSFVSEICTSKVLQLDLF